MGLDGFRLGCVGTSLLGSLDVLTTAHCALLAGCNEILE
jgi:hypothetical protein